jgi:hypothetical protein
MIYRIECWAGIAAGVAAALAAYETHWFVALWLGLLAVVCVGLVLWKPPE